MDYELSSHVHGEMQRRGIPLAVVEAVLATPQQKVPEHGDVLSISGGHQPKAVSGEGDGERDGVPDQGRDRLSHEQDQQILEAEDMKVTYDPEVDVLRILFRNVPIEESDEDKPGVILDYDKDGNVVGMEVLNASERVENPRGVDYAVMA